ncbi:MAG TPA: class I SAM-dependent methyltransferase [Chromatiales bacterium]|nr:class I SAM-dependent methyltransferase [Chromatiales bacterium]
MPSDADLRRKWDQRYRDTEREPSPALALRENAYLLPPEGRVLDLACGLGANALFLAERGLETSAWDLSPVAVERLQARAAKRGINIAAEVRDVVVRPPRPASFDVIVVAHFLERGLVPALIDALRPGGLIYYQTFTREAVTDTGPSKPAYRLKVNELLHLFHRLTLRVYREEGRLGNRQHGVRDIAMLVAEKSAR